MRATTSYYAVIDDPQKDRRRRPTGGRIVGGPFLLYDGLEFDVGSLWPDATGIIRADQAEQNGYRLYEDTAPQQAQPAESDAEDTAAAGRGKGSTDG